MDDEINMTEKQMLRTITFIETIRQRFETENLTALNIKNAGVKEDNEYLQFWLDKNKDEYELIGFDIRRTTKEERINALIDKANRLSNELGDNHKKIEFLKLRNEQIRVSINNTDNIIHKLNKY